MLEPEYIQSLPDNMVSLYAKAEESILADMARRINKYDYWIPAAEHQAKMLEEMGATREYILKQLKGLTGKTEKEILQLMNEAGIETVKEDDLIYQAAGLKPSPIEASKELQAVLQGGYKKTIGLFSNLTKTTANTGANQFINALDEAYMKITTGAFDYNTATIQAIKDLSKKGIESIKYNKSGRVDTIETAVRRAVVTGVNQTCAKLQLVRAEEMGCTLFEVSAHSGARPSHAEWQGKIYRWNK